MTSAPMRGAPWQTTMASTSGARSSRRAMAAGSSLGPKSAPPSDGSQSQSAKAPSRSRSAGAR